MFMLVCRFYCVEILAVPCCLSLKLFLHKILTLTSLKSDVCVCVCVCVYGEPDVNVGKPRPVSLYLSFSAPFFSAHIRD